MRELTREFAWFTPTVAWTASADWRGLDEDAAAATTGILDVLCVARHRAACVVLVTGAAAARAMAAQAVPAVEMN